MLHTKYRPQSMSEIVGQDFTVAVVKKAIAENKMAHTVILSGIRGSGKTSIARLIAKEMDIHPSDIFEVNVAAANSVDDAKKLVQMARVPANYSKKIYILDEAHSYTPQAQTALLKLFEEPSKRVLFILCTTEPHKLLPTIRSRALSLNLRKINIHEIVSRLTYVCEKESIAFEVDALYLIANDAGGSLRDALSTLELCRNRCLVSDVENMTGLVGYVHLIKLIRAISQAKLDDSLVAFRTAINKFEVRKYLLEVSSFVRDLFFCKSPDCADLLPISETRKKEMGQLLKELTLPYTLKLLNDMNRTCNFSQEYSDKFLILNAETIITNTIMHRKQFLRKLAEKQKNK